VIVFIKFELNKLATFIVYSGVVPIKMTRLALILSIILIACTNKSGQVLKSQQEFNFVSESFKTFYEQFIADSIYQMSRINFPISGKYQNYEEERKWTKDNWVLITWDFRKEMNNQEDSTSIIQDSSTFFYGTYCKECGFSLEIRFNKIKGQWFLTHRQENNY
jgi:hypothetical protein